MANQMLVDATHPEETRVVVVRGSRVEEFDFESANRKQLRGNIYLAKVTRVEPSLQAAFVDYGGNRHGFLAFSEIHPDYYQIPVADRQALLEEEKGQDDESEAAEAADESAKSESQSDATASSDEDADGENVEQVGAEDAMEEVPERSSRRRARQYKIQEVIKRRQILLVQVVKEERGNKGAALTTYLSLAGRYSVLMPNTARGGGISRKITNITDRKRLKKIASDLDVADGMGVILRTAGASRTKAEIKRDFEYLLRLWENVRDLTLKSAAPLLVYEEGSLIKRSIRDLYNKDIDQVLVSGEDGYREAKDFMRMLMPSHAKNVQPYREEQPIFTRCGIEPQLDAMFSPQVTLKSGGYIVIDQTEALVSIDVNSGRSTREHNIEDTALSTNLEAAEEISRQLRLRDLAGLVVIDFIDMEEKRNNRAVEKRLKDCLKSDRARIQVGRISHFGLMEMSRQRIRTGVLESTMDPCPHCHGTGHVRAAASVALLVLRTIEDHLLRGVAHHLLVKTRTNVALYILNQKRQNLAELETRFGVNITIEVEENLEGKHLEIERGEPLDKPVAATPTVSMLTTDKLIADEDSEEDERQEQESESSSKKRRRRRRRKKPSSAEHRAENAAEDGSDSETDENTPESGTQEDEGSVSEASAESASADEDEKPKKSRRRGRRGGRRNRRNRSSDEENTVEAEAGESSENAEAASEGSDAEAKSTPESAPEAATAEAAPSETAEAESSDAVTDDGPALETEAAPETKSASPAESPEGEAEVPPVEAEASAESTEPQDAPAQEAGASQEETAEAEGAPVETSQSQANPAPEQEAQAADAPQEEAKAEKTKEEEPRPKRSGWWQRSGFL
ncbi:MAG: Rne/Rng family ribonuclease [Cohaesibacter sp.]|jgi:ribonuclease E|nr:Rne/Rng family ribonuclease [Cohaesibacter sp.]